MTNSSRNLLRRPAKPAQNRGRIRRSVWEELVFNNGMATTAQVLDRVYAHRRLKARRLGNGGWYQCVRRRLDEIADRVGRSTGRGRPWLYRLRPGWGPPGKWDTMYDETGERMRDENGEIITRDTGPPPLKWSDLRYVFDIKEDCNGKEAIQARRDCREAAAGRCSGLAGPEYAGRNPPDRGERGDVLSVAPGVWRAEVRAGEAPEGP